MKINHLEYLNFLLAAVDIKAIQQRQYRILFDPVNGSATDVGKKLFSQLGKLIMINDQVGQKPLRPSEPRRETLTQTAQAVVKNHCDLGIATDVDADRVLFIDGTGTILSEDLTAVILAKNKKTLVTPVNSSGLFKAESQKWGAQVIECRVGPPEIISAIKQYRADFAYEESGKYFFPQQCLWADGLLAGVQMLGVMAQENLSLHEISQQYSVYHQIKLAINCPWEKMPKQFVGDGVKQIFGDSFMFIRASGTEPLIRIFSDAPSLKQAQKLINIGKQIVKKELDS